MLKQGIGMAYLHKDFWKNGQLKYLSVSGARI
ncbi:MAG: hypothetical protein MZV63_25485 [Marinilabiliales bacterium]|nr:hypothetical protein [Marinilabiliales bacterium]